MSRPPKPTALLSPDAFKRNPQRTRKNEPQSNGPLGQPPERLSAEERAAWRELAGNTPEGVLTRADRTWVEIAARLLARLHKEGIGGRFGLNVGELSQINNFLSKMGLNPSDRTRLSVPQKPESDNPFAEIASEVKSDTRVISRAGEA